MTWKCVFVLSINFLLPLRVENLADVIAKPARARDSRPRFIIRVAKLSHNAAWEMTYGKSSIIVKMGLWV